LSFYFSDSTTASHINLMAKPRLSDS